MSTHFRVSPESLDDWISQSEAARIRGVSRQAIGRLVARGRLATVRVGGRDLVSRQELESLVLQRPGRKPAK